MNSPSAELNAYILDYKAKKLLQNSRDSSSTPFSKRQGSPCAIDSRSWLHDVLTVPPELKHKNKVSTTPINVAPTKSTDSSVSKWLDDIDKKIAQRFPQFNESTTINNTIINQNESFQSDDTLQLVSSDATKGMNEFCVCASYDSHSARQNEKSVNFLDNDTNNNCEYRNDLNSPAWVDDILNDNVCDSCIEKGDYTEFGSDEKVYKPEGIEQSVELPDGFKLYDSKRDRSRKKKVNKSKSSSRHSSKRQNNVSKSPVTASPEAENLMKLLKQAIVQLQEVKVAVEDNTVSAITSDNSCTTSQALSDLPID